MLQDVKKAMELWKQALALGSSKAHSCLAEAYRHELGDLKKAQFHYEAAAMQDMKWIGITLDTWRENMDVEIELIGIELLSIGQSRHQLGIILPRIS